MLWSNSDKGDILHVELFLLQYQHMDIILPQILNLRSLASQDFFSESINPTAKTVINIVAKTQVDWIGFLLP